MTAAPDYHEGTLAAVLPSVVAALGSSAYAGRSLLDLAPSERAVVVLVDAMGDVLIRRRRGHAPFLRTGLDTAYRLDCGFPSTTATSTATFGTGLAPGEHGLVGFEVLVPETDTILNQLSWEGGPDPRRWQPMPTVFEVVGAHGIAVTRIGPGFFNGSGLTTAAARGGAFVAASGLADGVDAALAAARATPRALVYLYWGELDKVGHVHGCESLEWGLELERVDRELARLVESVPADTAVYVTADHGMVDVPFADRVDVAHEPTLAAGVEQVGGEPRGLHLYCRTGAADDVLAAWRERLGDRLELLSRQDAMAAGWFGPVHPRVVPRIGDVVGSARGTTAVVDSRTARKEVLALLGLHGARTDAEQLVPLLVTRGRA